MAESAFEARFTWPIAVMRGRCLIIGIVPSIIDYDNIYNFSFYLCWHIDSQMALYIVPGFQIHRYYHIILQF